MSAENSSEKKDYFKNNCIIAILSDGKKSVAISLNKVEAVINDNELTEFYLVSGRSLTVLTESIKPVSDISQIKLLA